MAYESNAQVWYGTVHDWTSSIRGFMSPETQLTLQGLDDPDFKMNRDTGFVFHDPDKRVESAFKSGQLLAVLSETMVVKFTTIPTTSVLYRFPVLVCSLPAGLTGILLRAGPLQMRIDEGNIQGADFQRFMAEVMKS